jgi:hypothetical protein
MINILIPLIIQIVFFIPFYIIYKKDCKELGKENLAVSLEERFIYWLLLCPFWIISILQLLDYFKIK